MDITNLICHDRHIVISFIGNKNHSFGATFIPNSAELIIVLELNVLSDASVLTSIPFDLEFMMSGNAKMCSNNYTLNICKWEAITTKAIDVTKLSI